MLKQVEHLETANRRANSFSGRHWLKIRFQFLPDSKISLLSKCFTVIFSNFSVIFVLNPKHKHWPTWRNVGDWMVRNYSVLSFRKLSQAFYILGKLGRKFRTRIRKGLPKLEKQNIEKNAPLFPHHHIFGKIYDLACLTSEFFEIIKNECFFG